jgi:hypothetical protein
LSEIQKPYKRAMNVCRITGTRGHLYSRYKK